MMAASRTRPGNPDRGWNDPPMFNYDAGAPQGPPKRSLNKRVAFPLASSQQPGHAVLNPSQGPPIVNPVLPAELQSQPPLPAPTPAIPIGMRDTPLGNQAPPTSPIQLLPPTADTSPPQAVPLLVPTLIPVQPAESQKPAGLDEERMEELMSRLSLSDDGGLLQHNLDNLTAVLDKYRGVLTMKACEEIQKKVDLFQDRWKKGALGEIVKIRITQMTTALVNEDTEKANHLHLALMIDHITEVNQWMVGVKRLLQQQQLAQKEKELISQLQQENNQAKSGETTPTDNKKSEDSNPPESTSQEPLSSAESS